MRWLTLATVSLLFAGCYHATIDAGLQPSGERIEQPWAHGFVYGLVPPSTVETASRCPDAVARVETQHSFLNQLATMLTFGIYSPMTITVDCAGTRSSAIPRDAETLAVRRDATSREVGTVLGQAARRSAELHQPVWVSFE